MPTKHPRPKGNARQMPPPWLSVFNQCLWHIHRSSSILFLCLVLLNGLAGVLSSIERNKLAGELRKKVASNLTTSSEEEELTRQILALFDYDDENGSQNNQTNSTDSGIKLELAENSTKLEMEFSVDMAASNALEGIGMFGNGTGNGNNKTVERAILTGKNDQNAVDNSTTKIAMEGEGMGPKMLEGNETMEKATILVENATMNPMENQTLETINSPLISEGITMMNGKNDGMEGNLTSGKGAMEGGNESSRKTMNLEMTTKIAEIRREMNETESKIEGNNLVEEGGIKEEENAVKAAIGELQKQIQQKGGELGGMEIGQLREYREHLKRILANVENILAAKGPPPVQMSDFSKSKRFIAISSSLPNWESALLMNRKNALSASVDAQIRKSPPHPPSKIAATNSAEAAGGMPPTASSTLGPMPTTNGGIGNEGATTAKKEIAANRAESGNKMNPVGETDSNESSSEQWNPRKNGFVRAEAIASNSLPFNPTRNNSWEHCKHLSEAELVNELKQKGTYNPELMAWDVSGVFRFLDRSIVDQYERQSKPPKSSEQAVRRNVEALEQLLGELNLQCEVRTPEVMSRLNNLTLTEPRRSIISPSLRNQEEIRHKRNAILADKLVQSFNSSLRRDSPMNGQQNGKTKAKKQKLIGDVHVVPFGCDKRGYAEDGYLRLCGACQAIRKLPDEFFPPFINEVMCDEDKACLYFYDYPHGKCKQKHMNFVVLRNVGTQLCQVWEKFNLNVRVSCECFVDEMSFFAKYV